MSDKVLIKGNEAIGEAAIQAGCRFFFGYPITPQTELSEYLAKRLPKIGGTFLQAESEVAAINMVMGASSAGVRVMTSSSSPGISLKTEGISYMIGCDLPAVICNVQRGGPGLGGIQPSQADYFQATKAPGHGDAHVMVIAPSTIQEIINLTMLAFDLADQYRMPAMLLADGALGQMMEPAEFSSYQKRALPEKTWATDGPRGKRERNIINSLYIQPDELEQKVVERAQRYAAIERDEVLYEEQDAEDADIVLVAFGITARIAKSAVKAARARGLKVGLVRPITLWPFPKDVLAKRAETAKAFLTLELSLGQMVEDVRLAVNGKKPVHFYGRTGGMMMTPDEVTAEIEKIAASL